MGSREIAILTHSVGGKVHVPGQPGSVRTESTLETDFTLLCAFDPTVEQIESQPVTIPYRDPTGRERHYTPDFLVQYLPDRDWVRRKVPELVEVKRTEDLTRRHDEYALKFEVARAYAEWRGWTFRIVTDQDLRGPYLQNAKFLLPYLRRPAWHEPTAWDIRKAMETLREAEVRALLATLTPDPEAQLRYLPHIWQMVAYRYLGADLQLPLNMRTPLTYLPHDPYPLKKDWIHDGPR
ncbi:TnsA endonuclease N-terminal domain-containing protein [Deinococcus budaensis]|uniref:TnsA endonuclease N-terminal domain-containing protein n=1 Tax=Deinococcus budaensis TaxID=1665626 RepID=A0A7W8GH52_9DEIO|nr:TnsA endonuclease N-terminal domain-containing protein [Deinococcus budaensis]MBB5235393.1 hypothetical protein [Deinococcus budaensis]